MTTSDPSLDPSVPADGSDPNAPDDSTPTDDGGGGDSGSTPASSPSSSSSGTAPTAGGPASFDSAAYRALWTIYANTGIRPEWLLPVLDSESGLNPGAQNSLGYTGLNQISPSYLQGRGIDPSDYVTWPASQQLSQVVGPFLQAQVSAFGKLGSGTKVYQANFLPATLKTAKTLDSVLATKANDPYQWYADNAVFDWQNTGTITVGDLAHFVSKMAGSSVVKAAIANAYAIAPAGVGSPTDPVYGTDFPQGGGVLTVLAWVAGTALALGVAAVVLHHMLSAKVSP